MGQGDFERAAELFEQLVWLAPEQRATALERSTHEGPLVLAQLRRMLAGAEHPCPALERPEAAPVLPESIGGFRVLRLLGEGGMGRVFEAEQHAPRRRVALKVIRAALASPAVQRRFEREALVLGRLKHPGLATVYEAGSAVLQGERVPFLAMELVEGEALDGYLARARPGLRARIELVAQVCDAVQHAHERGVVHRDLKPSNVLVESSGRPRVLDFGIARLTGADLEGTTQHTDPGAVLGTLPYMSPEQIAGDSHDVDLRTDVYALGVLLYEALSGRRPLDLSGKTLAEAARIVTHEEPAPLGALDPRLRGDLDTIASKALAKEKQRRYASAAELAEDLRRTLRDEPISARPVTTLYQLVLFARRNRRFVGALAFALVSLVGGLCASLILAVRERSQRALAEERAAALEQQLYRQGIAEVQRELGAGRHARARELVAAIPRGPAGWELAHLEDRLSALPVALRGHTGSIWRLRADRSGSILASASADRSVRLWQVPGGACTQVLDPAGEPRRMDLSSDGRRVFALGWDTRTSTMTASLWEEGRLVRAEPYRSEEMGWGECAFEPTGALVLWGWNDGVLRAWEASSGRERYAVRLHASDLRALAVDGRGQVVATGGEEGDCTIQLVDLASGARLHGLPAQESPVAELYFLGREPVLLSRTQAGALSLWDVQSGERRARLDLGEPVLSVTSSGDGTRLYAGTASGRLLAVDVATARTAAAHDAGAPVGRLALLEERHVLAAGTRETGVQYLDSDTGQVLGTFASGTASDSGVSTLLALPGGRGLAAGSTRGEIRLLPAEARAFEVLRGHGSYVYGVAFVRGGSTIASGSWDRTLRLWETATGNALGVLPLAERVVALLGLARGRVLVALMNGEAQALDLGDGSTAWRRPGYGWGVTGAAACASPDGERVLLVDPRASVAHVLDGDDGALLAVGALPAAAHGVVWDAQDRWIAAGAPDQLCFLDARTLEPRRTLPLAGTPTRLALSADARWLALGLRDGTTEIMDVESGVRAARLPGGHGIVYALAFDPGGARLALGTEDGSVSVWETRSWTRVLDLDPHLRTPAEPTYRYVFELAFSPDGQQLVSASGDHTLRLWRGPPPLALPR